MAEEDSPLDYVFYFVFMALALGAVCKEVKKLTAIPYTPMLLILGMVWGLLENYFGYVGRAAEMTERIEPVSDR